MNVTLTWDPEKHEENRRARRYLDAIEALTSSGHFRNEIRPPVPRTEELEPVSGLSSPALGEKMNERELRKLAADTPERAEQMVDNLWSRIGRTLRTLVKTMEQRDAFSLQELAADMGKEYRSVRSSFNGPLAKAVKTSIKAVPGAPESLWTFVWQGTHYEMKLLPNIRAALAKRRIDD